MQELYKKEIAFKLNTDNNVKQLSEYLLSDKGSRGLFVKIFLSTFYIYDLDLDPKSTIEKQLSLILFHYHDLFKKIDKLPFKIFQLIDSYKKLDTKNIDNVYVNYDHSSEELLINYSYNDLYVKDVVKIPRNTYDRVFQKTLEKSILHTNLIFMRYFYGLNFFGKNYATLDFNDIHKSGYKMECFASSFNRYSDYFCALYDDIDIYSVGYLGNFFNLTAEELIEKINWDNNLIKLTFNPPFVYFLINSSFVKLYELMDICHNTYKFNFEINIDLPAATRDFLKPLIDKFVNFSKIHYSYPCAQNRAYIDRLSDEKIMSPQHVQPMKIIIKSEK